MVSQDLYCVLVGALGGFIFGYSTGIIGGLSTPLVCQWFLDPTQTLHDGDGSGKVQCGSGDQALTSAQSFYQGLLTAEILVGAFMGAFLGPWVANRFGRRAGCLATGLIALVTSVLLALPFVSSYWAVVFIRTLQGVCVGFSSTVCPMYVSEMASEDKRGKLGTVFQIFICGSILVAQFMNYLLNQDNSVDLPAWNWHLQLGLCALPAVVLVVLSQLIPESTTFLTAQSSAASPMNPTPEAESPSSPTSLSSQPHKSQWGLLFSGAGWKWVAVGVILSAANQLTGINGIVFYAPSIFKTHFSDPLMMTFIAVGGWNFLSVFLSFFLVDRFSRKSLLIVTLTLMTIATLLLGFTDMKEPILPTISKYVSVLAVMLFVGAFECGIGPLFWMMAVEMYPAHIEHAALSFTNATVWTCNILLTFCFPLVSNALKSQSKTFFLLSAIGAVCTLLIFWVVPASGGGKQAGGRSDDDLLINDSSFRDLGESEDEEERESRKFQ